MSSSGPVLVIRLTKLVASNLVLRIRAAADLSADTTRVAGADVDSLEAIVDVVSEQLHDEWTDTVEGSTRYWSVVDDRR